jgi:hypothetical protein
MKISSERSDLYLYNIRGEDLNNSEDKCILSALILYVYRSIRNVESYQDKLFYLKFSFQEIKIFLIHTMKAHRGTRPYS